MQFHRSSGSDVRHVGGLVEQEDQPGPLMLAMRHRPPTNETAASIKELGWERGPVEGRGARHGATPSAISDRISNRTPRG